MKEIFDGIKTAVKDIAQALKYSDFGYTANQNATGDTQLKLDVLSDEIITKTLSKINLVKELVSEEKEEALKVSGDGEYIVAYDPLDGSSLVDVNFAVGSIFGIYKGSLNPANLVASVYSVYGPRTELVIAKDKVELFRLDKNGDFAFASELRLKEKGKLNATGGSQKGWDEKHKDLIKSLFDEGYRLRYSGAMVSDLHQILLKGGGLFSYPATSDAPKGKLRLSFEVLPFAFIYELAGGYAVDNVGKRLLAISLEKVHQTSPCYFGSKYEIEKVKACLA